MSRCSIGVASERNRADRELARWRLARSREGRREECGAATQLVRWQHSYMRRMERVSVVQASGRSCCPLTTENKLRAMERRHVDTPGRKRMRDDWSRGGVD